MQLFLCRLGVGVGEAGGVAPSYALIADYYPPERRARALAIFSLGIPLGLALGTLIGAYLAAWVSWRAAFIAMGVAGVVLAPVMLIVVRDRAPPADVGSADQADRDLRNRRAQTELLADGARLLVQLARGLRPGAVDAVGARAELRHGADRARAVPCLALPDRRHCGRVRRRLARGPGRAGGPPLVCLAPGDRLVNHRADLRLRPVSSDPGRRGCSC